MGFGTYMIWKGGRGTPKPSGGRLVSMQCEADATAKLAAVRAVLGERHEQWISKCGSGCLVSEPVYGNTDPAPWPCVHERVRRAVEGE